MVCRWRIDQQGREEGFKYTAGCSEKATRKNGTRRQMRLAGDRIPVNVKSQPHGGVIAYHVRVEQEGASERPFIEQGLSGGQLLLPALPLHPEVPVLRFGPWDLTSRLLSSLRVPVEHFGRKRCRVGLCSHVKRVMD